MIKNLQRLVSIPITLVLLSFAGTVPALPGAAPDHAQAPLRLRFGQSLALSDFDGDNLADRARLGGAGLRKSIEIYLSGTGKTSLLQFETQTVEHGSLFADDVNNDGDVDLVWTDLLHPDEVVIWLNTGLGKFEKTASERYAANYVIQGAGASASDTQNTCCLIGPARGISLDLAAAGSPSTPLASLLPILAEETPLTSLNPNQAASPTRGPPSNPAS